MLPILTRIDPMVLPTTWSACARNCRKTELRAAPSAVRELRRSIGATVRRSRGSSLQALRVPRQQGDFLCRGRRQSDEQADGGRHQSTRRDLRVTGVTPLLSISSPLQSGYFYAPAPDGQRFLVNVEPVIESNPPPITVVFNWTAGPKNQARMGTAR